MFIRWGQHRYIWHIPQEQRFLARNLFVLDACASADVFRHVPYVPVFSS